MIPVHRPRSTKIKQVLQLALGTVVSLGFLWLSFRNVDWISTWQMTRRASAPWLVAALLSVILTTLVRAERWRLMLRSDHRRLRLSKFTSVLLIGQMTNAVIPARVGELVRAYLIGEAERVGKVAALWTTVVEKVLDSLTLLFFLLMLSLSVSLPEWLSRAGWLLSLGLVAVLLSVVGVVLFRDAVLHWVEGLQTRYQWVKRLRLHRLLEAVVASLSLVRSAGLAWSLLGWSVVVFLTAAGTNWIVARALGIDLPISAALLLLVVLQISAVVPIPTSPARVGLFHYLCVITLGIFGLERSTALGYGLVLHLVTYLPMSLGGPFCLWLEHYDWQGLLHLLRNVPGDGKDPQP